MRSPVVPSCLALLLAACAGAAGANQTEPPSVAAASEQGERKGHVGVLEHRDVNLHRIRLQLGHGRACRLSELSDAAGDDGVLEGGEAGRAGCMVRLYRGVLPVYAVARGGTQREQVLTPRADGDGFVDLEFAEVDAVLAARGAGRLDDYERLELGTGAWAGTINLDRLRGFLSQWHYQWAKQGRGALGLFVARHPEHPKSTEAEAMVIQDRIARQERDYEKVKAGQMTASEFLERHVWSPFRRAVAGGEPEPEPDPRR